MSTTTGTMNTMPVSLDINSKDMVDLVDRLAQCFHWLRSKNVHMYVGKTELTIEKLEKATNELEVRLNVAVDYMEDALRNGWFLKRLAVEWIEQGLVYIGHADEVIDKYKNHQMDDSTASVLLNCPCETLSRRTLNSRAILRLNDILDHTDAGKKYHAEEEGGMEAVATPGQRGADAIRSDDCAVKERFAKLVSPPVSQGLRNEPTTVAVPPDSHVVIPSPPVNGHHQRQSLAPNDIQKMKLSGLAKYHAFPRAESLPCVPVMIRVNAPAYTRRSRAAIDLVMVLDASESMMYDGKLDQLKQGCMFVILNLDARDRLSIVTFGMKKKEFTLKSMSADGKTLANKFVRRLKAHAYGEKRTEANEAMDRAYEILGQPDGNPVRSVLLLANGRDKTIFEESLKSTEEVLLKRRKYATYTFGFGRDHDPRTLYYLATSGYGTYSFVGESRSIRDAMALCIGCLTSIVAQDVKVTIRSAHEDVKIQAIMSGGYDIIRRRRVASGGISSGFTIDVKDLCASEEKKFIVYVNVPREEAATAIFPAGTPKTKLLAVTATYDCPFTRTDVSTDTVEVSMERPKKLRDRDRDISVDVEVAGEVTRADMFNGVEKAWLESTPCTSYMNLHVPCKKLRKQLTKLKKSVGGTEEAREARERWDDLATDLKNMKDMSNIGRFSIETGEDLSSRITGLPYMLSWLSSHRWQRAATPGSSSKSRWFNFRTTRMQNMIDSVDIAPIAL